MNFKMKEISGAATGQKDILSYSGGGKVSVPVASIVGSEKVQRQVAAVKQIEAAQLVQKK